MPSQRVLGTGAPLSAVVALAIEIAMGVTLVIGSPTGRTACRPAAMLRRLPLRTSVFGQRVASWLEPRLLPVVEAFHYSQTVLLS